MKLIGYTCVYNEEKMIPYVMPYVERLGYDKFIVYDNGSTDKTVELLSQYPFVEIRHYDTNGVFSETAKTNIQKEGYIECFHMAKVNQPDEEQIWMTFTDFDEVLFYGGRSTFKGILELFGQWYGFNCFSGQMVELLPPQNIKFTKPLLHMEENMKCKWWGLQGNKPLLILVNDVYESIFNIGNHSMQVKCRRKLKDLKNDGNIHAFHLKYVDKDVLKEKINNYVVRNGANEYKPTLNIFEKMYEQVYSIGFPIEIYFALKYFDIQKDEIGGIHEE